MTELRFPCRAKASFATMGLMVHNARGAARTPEPKPWVETWFTSMKGSGIQLCREVPDDEDAEDLNLIARSFEQPSGDLQLARMDLAAAAPEMARLLLEIEWSEDSCLFCSGDHPYLDIRLPSMGPSIIPLPSKADIEEAKQRPMLGGHAESCRLVAVLRKAGVLP